MDKYEKKEWLYIPPGGLRESGFLIILMSIQKTDLGGLEMKKKAAALLLTSVLAVSMLAGCGQKGSGETSAVSKETGASDKNDTDTKAAADDNEKEGIVCYVGHGFWDGSLDPIKGAYAYGYDFTNNALLCVAPDSSYTDDLAESWAVSDDALTYTFHLKEGIRFQDGSDFSAEDVVFTY